MENPEKKCSSDKHDQIALSYCNNCKVYMCNKCSNLHSELFGKHQTINLAKEIEPIFSGICQEEKHKNDLEYFCKNHNTLCCAACISKIQSKGNGKHKNCNVCNIEEIKDEKKNTLKNNIEYLEDLSKNIEKSINELKKIFEKINNNKENLKLKIQKIFTELRTALKEREDQLLLKVDEQFKNLFFDEEIIKIGEKLPKKLSVSLEKGKLLLDKVFDNNDNKLNALVNDCIYIENNIKDIKTINEHITKYNSNNIDIIFKPEKIENNELLNLIKKFGNISNKENQEIIKEVNVNIKKNIYGKMLQEKDVDLFIKWIKSDDINISEVYFELCYDAKKNGDDKKNFHKYCDNVGPSLLIIKTESNYIFGGFTKKNWELIKDREYIYGEDNNAFLFSLNNRDRIKVKNSKRAIVNDADYGPIFGHGAAYEICLFYPFLSSRIQIEDRGDYGDKNLILVGNKSKKPIEIELYKVIIYYKK